MTSSLLALPRELRDQIYMDYLNLDDNRPMHYLNLLLTNRQIGTEVHAVMLSKSNLFTVSLPASTRLSTELVRMFPGSVVSQPVLRATPIYNHQSTLHITIQDPGETDAQQTRMLMRILDHKPPCALLEFCWTVATASREHSNEIGEYAVRQNIYNISLLTSPNVVSPQHATQDALLLPFRTAWWCFGDVSFSQFTDTELVLEVHAAVTGIPWNSQADMIAYATPYLEVQQERLRGSRNVSSMLSICRETDNLITAIQESAAPPNGSRPLNPVNTRTNLIKLVAPWAKRCMGMINARLRSLVPIDSTISDIRDQIARARSFACELAAPTIGLYDVLASIRGCGRHARRAEYALAMASAWVIIGRQDKIDEYERMFKEKCQFRRDLFDAGTEELRELKERLAAVHTII